MKRLAEIRRRNRIYYRIWAPFDVLWNVLKALFKALLNGIQTHHENDVFRP